MSANLRDSASRSDRPGESGYYDFVEGTKLHLSRKTFSKIDVMLVHIDKFGILHTDVEAANVLPWFYIDGLEIDGTPPLGLVFNGNQWGLIRWEETVVLLVLQSAPAHRGPYFGYLRLYRGNDITPLNSMDRQFLDNLIIQFTKQSDNNYR